MRSYRAQQTAEGVARGRVWETFAMLACLEVRMARSRLEMTPEEFGLWLEEAVGWLPPPGMVEAWEDGSESLSPAGSGREGVPPGDVVMAARATWENW